VATYHVGVASWSVVGIEAVARAFLQAVPPAVLYALRPRDLVLRLAGRSSSRGSDVAKEPLPLVEGWSAGALRLVAVSPAEVVLTPDARLLDVRVSLRLENDWTRRWLAVTTVVRPRSLGGTIALGPFARLHARIMPAIVGEVARAVDTPKPAPPGQRLSAAP
jgi:hypothetical protein